MAKSKWIAHRSERVGMGDKTFDLVAGEELSVKLTDDEIQQLVDSQQIYDASGVSGNDIYSQDYRDLQTLEDAEEDKGKK